ncbi:SDR family NAD(P)-dependent oxidoreductase [Nocardioides houyundeii]|uniref:SDR family NAD(P)-dependent oxidoreductase n=1 Tax=Nocardioides houyundeii TaxID=2045452 RepID=UPI000C77C687|nr:SDR family oxidoreductase [Nocardioides houyundeii]
MTAQGPAAVRGARGVVVTGAARGLGRGIVEVLAEAGYAVVAVDLLPDVAETAASLGEGHEAVVGDVTDPDVIRSAAERAAALGDGLLAAVFNAGVASPGDSVSYPLTEWDRVLDVNLRGVFVGARTVRPLLAPGGSMVMLSSIAASQGFAARAAYCSSKAGVEGLVRSLSMEWGPEGIRVNAVAPGTIETEMQRRMIEAGRLSSESALQRIPMGRIGHPHDIGNAVEFLVSPRAAYVSGVVLPVDGGWAGGGLPATV